MLNGNGKPTTRRRFGSVLFVICALFVTSVLLRLGGGIGEAIASQKQDSGVEVAQNTPETVDVDQQVDDLLQQLMQREAALAEKEKDLEIRQKEVALVERKVNEGLRALVQAEEDLAATLARADGAEEEDLMRLTAVYENMKPKAAAPLFEEMDPEFAAGFLARMRPDAAAAIIAGLDPQVAYSISVILANRNRAAPKN